jgi:uncharacterized protein YceH (UPF0502 family)
VTEPFLQLTVLEARVLGALIEKEVTTPDQYPLSINSLRLACNQKSNRDPFMETDESAVQETVNGLMRQFLVAEAAGNRVPRYRQSLCGDEHARFIVSPQERALLCELLLRGPQTAGELRSRAQRMASFPALNPRGAGTGHPAAPCSGFPRSALRPAAYPNARTADRASPASGPGGVHAGE